MQNFGAIIHTVDLVFIPVSIEARSRNFDPDTSALVFA
jgi:hypothetical protein